MRIAIYARFSSELQRDTSIDDQIAVAKRYAKDRGWEVVRDHIYIDAAISGVSIQGRAAIQRLLVVAAQQPKPFDVLLVDDSSRVARNIADAVRVMQRLKFLGIRVIYISQGIDSESEQAEALVTVHGLIDSLYLKELATKIKRGLAGQLDRGFATGAKQYGYRTVPVPDPSGRKNDRGEPALLGKRLEIIEAEAKIIRRIFEWAADGWGLAKIVHQLNTDHVPGTRGKRWSKTAVSNILRNERYLGKQIWGQQYVKHEPDTGRKFMRNNPRKDWRIHDRPELRIIPDDLWARTQATRAAIRDAVAPKRNLARGKDARFHSTHLLTGFCRCGVCEGAMTSVSGGSGSPRIGCARSWQHGISACPNRLTQRMKVVEPLVLARLREELLKPAAVNYIIRGVERAVTQALQSRPQKHVEIRRQLEQVRRELQNLVAAIAAGDRAPATVLKAIAEGERTIERLEKELRNSERSARPARSDAEIRIFVREQLQDFVGLLKCDPAKTKSEFRRLNLQLTFQPVEAKPRPYFVVNGQCELSALAFFYLRTRSQGAVLDRLLVNRARARSSSPARSTSSVAEEEVRSSP